MTLSASRTGHPSIKDVGVAPSTSAGSPPITQINFLTCRAHYPGGPNRCVSVSSLSARPSPVNRRVGIHDFTFEACSSFTRVTACKVARPPKGGLLSRGFDPASYPTKLLGSYRVLPTTTWMDLATGAFINKREDALFLGPGGTGKSHLAQAVGQAAI